MASKDGASKPAVDSLLHELEQAPYQFDFFQALRLFEAAFPESPRLGKTMRLSEDRVRLKQEPSLRFAPSTIAAFKANEDGKPHDLSVYFLGLCGPNGPLPLHLTEYVRDRIRHHEDSTFAAFLDVFHHRILSLFYRAWADAQPTVHFDRPGTDRFSVYVESLLGIGSPAFLNRDAMPDIAKKYYAGHLACQTRYPEGLKAMLSDFFSVPVKIQEFLGRWVEIPPPYRFTLGEDPESGSLGVACTLGAKVWDCQQSFRIIVGPVDWEDFCRLLPDGKSLAKFSAFVRNYIGDEWRWDLNLVLKQSDVPGWTLGEGQLGQTIWMDQRGLSSDSCDLHLLPTHSAG
ncbi:MAG: type VI secretion system baseplate subunit TssG [Rhodopirellula sp.]|nr:type VI secretion system baseplate subunit TssG [Rhodopirellula sp.]